MQDFEFTIQEGKLYMLQTRNGKRTGPAAVRIAVAMVEEGMITKKEAIMRVAPPQLDQLAASGVRHEDAQGSREADHRHSASPGRGGGTRCVFTAEDAVEMSAHGPVLLVRKETTPDDIHGMDVAKGILTAIGGKSSHAAVVARGMGRPCIVGASGIRIDEHKKVFTAQVAGKTVAVKEGDFISLDGTTGDVYAGHAKSVEPNLSHDYIGKFMGWTDEFRGKFGVRANADIPRDAKVARAVRRGGHRAVPHGAHVLRRRPPAARAGDDSGRDEKDRPQGAQQASSHAALRLRRIVQGDGRIPVVIRTLDPPLHEFLPKRERPDGGLARLPMPTPRRRRNVGRLQDPGGKLKKRLPELLHRVEELHEFNPMLGHRGCRLGIAYPEITEMQARAIFEAVAQVAKKGIKVIPEVMIPLIGSVEEFENQKNIVVRVADEVFGKAGLKDQHYLVGTMIEIPRAALLADTVAKEAEFFSFGTNDLTQTTMGLSRDDYTKFQKIYEEKKIFKADPFAVIDQQGVGKLVRDGDQARQEGARTDLEVGICGEHGGEPSSVGSATGSGWTTCRGTSAVWQAECPRV